MVVTRPGDAGARVQVGTVIAGKYVLLRHLGQGGMGTVFEAIHQGTEGRVAIKFLRPTDDDEEQRTALARFAREARAAGRLRSRFIARVLDVDRMQDGTPYIVMEYLDGSDLSALMRGAGEPFSVEQVVAFAIQACAGLAEAHAANIVHRDLKFGNLFVSREGGGVLKILDFGISKILGETDREVTDTVAMLGTVHYMSPEQLRAAREIDARTDIWSLGVVLFRALQGEFPFPGTPPEAIGGILSDAPAPRITAPNVPAELAAVVHKALEKDVARRYATVEQLAAALAPFARSDAPPVKEALDELSRSSRIEKMEAPTAKVGRAGAASEEPLASPTLPTEAAWEVQAPKRRMHVALGVGAFAVVGVGLAAFVAIRGRAQDATAANVASASPSAPASAVDASAPASASAPPTPTPCSTPSSSAPSPSVSAAKNNPARPAKPPSSHEPAPPPTNPPRL